MAATHSERWLRAAQNDLETARVLLENTQNNACAFYAQQAAEKALKALLLSMNQTVWGHSNRDLLEVVEALGATGVTDTIRRAARELDRHYIPSRYPDAYPSGVPADYYDSETGQEALEWAREVVEYVISQMPGASRSHGQQT